MAHFDGSFVTTDFPEMSRQNSKGMGGVKRVGTGMACLPPPPPPSLPFNTHNQREASACNQANKYGT